MPGVVTAADSLQMIHNGIEHGMMSAIAESFNIMRDGLEMKDDDIADVFEKWNAEGELVCLDLNSDSRTLINHVITARNISHRYQYRHLS